MPGKEAPDERLLAAIAFTVGAGVMAVELTASRLLAPYFGASMFVWTSLIVTVLLALSFGYWFGGSLASKGHGVATVGILLCATSLLLVVGVGAMPTFALAVTRLLVSMDSASIALLIGSFAATVVSFATPVFLLAAVSPILVKAWSSGGDVGSASGRYFAVSTIGSVFGTVAPTIILVPELGAHRTIELVALAFLALGLPLLPRKRDSLAVLLIVPAILFVELRHASGDSQVIDTRESPYQLIRVLQDGDKKLLTFNEGLGFQSVYEPGADRTGFYYDYFALIPSLRRAADGGPPKTAVIGLAGGTAAREFGAFLKPGEREDVTGVEVDPSVIAMARKHFALDELPVKVVNEDGRMFLRGSSDRFDAVIVDAYSTELYIPPHMVTGEFFGLLHSRLAPGGLLVMNINAPSADSPLLKTLENTVASKFGTVRAVPVPGAWNWLVFASDDPIPLEQAVAALPEGWQDLRAAVAGVREVSYAAAAPVFTDDRAPVEFMTDAMVVKAVLSKSSL